MDFHKDNIFAIFILLLISLSTSIPVHAEKNEILNLDLSSLMKIQVTSAARKIQNIADVPAAIYVISQEDIHNSGVTSIPEALRMVPGLQVARINSSKWAITSRGFNGTFANKLLVQIDGRSVYTPSYSGVYWDVQNLVLEDVDRIEVIRGPGATLWGANAVNGIINIITKQASETLGGLASIGTGNHEKLLATLRYGAQFDENTYGRFYIYRHHQDSYKFLYEKTDADDDWKATSGGFRFDGDLGLKDSWTMQGDIYKNNTNQRVDTLWSWPNPNPIQKHDSFEPKGFNLLGRWTHQNSKGNSWSLQSYYDDNKRHEINVQQQHKIIDIDFQHRFQPFPQNDIVWGLGYRLIKDSAQSNDQIQVSPEKESYEIFSAFVQDEIKLTDRLFLTAGSKFEHNDISGIEIQPSIRLLWKADEKQSLWFAASKAVRTPSRVDQDVTITIGMVELPSPPYPPGVVIPIYALKNPDLDSEKLVAYEAGYRFSVNNDFSFDLSLYYNDYKDLRVFQQTAAGLQFYNGMKGETYGLEMVTKWVPAPWLKSEFSYSYIHLNFKTAATIDPEFADLAEKSSPRHQFSIRSNFALGNKVNLNLWGRYVDDVSQAVPNNILAPDLTVDNYFELDANIIWQARENLELMLVGQNLLDSHKLEFIQETYTSPIEIGRSIYAKITWKF